MITASRDGNCHNQESICSSRNVCVVLFNLSHWFQCNGIFFFLISHRLIKYRSQAPFSYFPVDLLKLMFSLKGQQTKMLNDILQVHVIDGCRSMQTQSHVRLSSYHVPNTALGALTKNSGGDWCESLKGGTMAWKTRTYLPCPSDCPRELSCLNWCPCPPEAWRFHWASLTSLSEPRHTIAGFQRSC